MIPKIAHFYFGGRAWSFMRYLTLYSFCKLNPKWEVFLHVPKNPFPQLKTWKSPEHQVKYIGRDYIEEVKKLPIMIREIDFKYQMSEVHRSDLIRLELLGGVGGWFFDTDILFIKPMSKLKIPKGIKQVLCKNKEGDYLIGMQGSCPFNDYFSNLYEQAIANCGKIDGYQGLGSGLMRHTEPKDGTYLLPLEGIYKYNWEQLDGVFLRGGELNENSIGIHWYGGHSIAGAWENTINETNVGKYDSLICKEICKIWQQV